MGKRLTQEEFEKRIKEQGNGEYTPLEDYQGSKTTILMKHESCGYEWKISPNNFFKGKRCPSCAKNRQRITQKEFEKRVEKLGNGNFTVLGKYKNNRTPTLMRHEVCGHEWKVKPKRFFEGTRCPYCFRINQRLTQKEFENRVNKKWVGEFTVLGKYLTNRTPVLVKHEKCGYEWKIAPSSLLKKSRCPFCARNAKKDTAFYSKEVENLEKNYKVIGKYKNNKEKVKMVHLECGNDFEMVPGNFLKGQRCPHCSQSHGENFVASFLKEHSIEYEFQKRFKDCKDKRALPFDFYIPALNSCIEFDGIQHFEPVDYFGGEKAFKEVQRRDGIKTKYCKEKGIKLLRIRYDEDVEEKMNSIFKKSKA